MIVDKQLVADCKRFDERAQSELYNRYSSLMFGICIRYCQNREEAEDLLQEGFLTIFNKVGQFKDEGSFLGWMKRVMVNTILISFRKKPHNDHLFEFGEVNELKIIDSQDNEEPEVNSEDVKAMIEKADFSEKELLEAASKLPDGYRMVFNLSVVEGYKHREIAEILNINESTSKSQLLRARKLLQKNLYILSVEKNEEKDKKKLVYAFAFLGMKDNINYIDGIVKKGFDNLKVPPSTEWSAISGKLAAAKGTSASSIPGSGGSTAGIQQGATVMSKITSSVVSFVTSNVYPIIGFVAASAIGVSLYTTTSSIDSNIAEPSTIETPEIISPTNNNAIIINESITSKEPVIVLEETPTEIENINLKQELNITIYDTVKVSVNKTIYKTKTK